MGRGGERQEYTTCKERPRNLGFSSLEKRLWRDPNSSVTSNISKEINKKLETLVLGRKIRGNAHKLEQGSFRLHVRKHFSL